MAEKMEWLVRLEEYLNVRKLNPYIENAGNSFELFKKEVQWRRQQILFFQHGPLNKP
jgi:transposase-like protein